MLRKIYISGAHSIGKTTLHECLKKHFRVENAQLIPCDEVARKIVAKENYTAKDFEDLDVCKIMLLQCVEDQIKLEEDLQTKEQNQDALAVFDRCVIGYIMYLKKEFGKSFSDDLFNRPDILKNTQCLSQDNSLVFVMKPMKKFFESDGIRAERIMNFDSAVEIDEGIREKMDGLGIRYVVITEEDIQERFDFVVDEIFKRWPSLKRGCMTRIPDDEKPKRSDAGPKNDS